MGNGPVSYTHLDVYKRQGYGMEDIQKELDRFERIIYVTMKQEDNDIEKTLRPKRFEDYIRCV